MQIKKLFDDDRAVSPVIGVILMVAITVILAAVIGTFVLGLGDQVSSTTPSASFNFDYESSDNQNLTIAHGGGDSLSPSQMTVSSTENFCPAPGNDTAGSPCASADAVSEFPLSTNADTSQWVSGDVSAGTSFTIVGVNNAADLDQATVRVVWSGESGDNSAVLGSWSGPNA